MLRVLRCVLRFRSCFCRCMVMGRVRAFCVVHALCSDVVVRVSALWSCSLFSLLFSFVWCLLFLLLFSCFLFPVWEQTAGGHWFAFWSHVSTYVSLL